jgi:hypothetical protein
MPIHYLEEAGALFLVHPQGKYFAREAFLEIFSTPQRIEELVDSMS